MTAPAPKLEPWLQSTLVIRMAWVVALTGLGGLGWLVTTEWAFLGGIPGAIGIKQRICDPLGCIARPVL